MGFGFMFLGLFFLFPTVPFPDAETGLSGFAGFIADFFGGSGKAALGFLLLFFGCGKAYKHCTRFDITKRLAGFGILFSLVCFAAGELASSGLVTNATYALYTVFLLGFFLYYMRSLLDVATDTGVDKIRRRAASGIILSFIFIGGGRILGGLGDFFPKISEKTAYWLAVGGFSAQVFYIIYALCVTFSCYMRICLEGDEDMPDNRKFKYKTPADFYEKKHKK